MSRSRVLENAIGAEVGFVQFTEKLDFLAGMTLATEPGNGRHGFGMLRHVVQDRIAAGQIGPCHFVLGLVGGTKYVAYRWIYSAEIYLCCTSS